MKRSAETVPFPLIFYFRHHIGVLTLLGKDVASSGTFQVGLVPPQGVLPALADDQFGAFGQGGAPLPPTVGGDTCNRAVIRNSGDQSVFKYLKL